MWHALEASSAARSSKNNFDRPNFRLMGNRDIWDPKCRSNFISRMNQKFCLRLRRARAFLHQRY